MRVKWIAAAAVLGLLLAPPVLADERGSRSEKLRIEVMVIEASTSGAPYVDRKLGGIASHLTRLLKFRRYALRKGYRRNARIGQKPVFALPGPLSMEIKVVSYDTAKGTYTLDIVLFKQSVRQAGEGAPGQRTPTRRVVVVKTRITKQPGSPAFIVCPRSGSVTHILAIMVN